MCDAVQFGPHLFVVSENGFPERVIILYGCRDSVLDEARLMGEREGVFVSYVGPRHVVRYEDWNEDHSR